MIPSNLKCQTTLPTEFSGRVYVMKANEKQPTELSATDKFLLKNRTDLCESGGEDYRLTDGTSLCKKKHNTVVKN